MRLIMAVSRDGYTARGPEDDMRWTGRDDKAVFRILTSGGVVGVGRKTLALMPKELDGRELVGLSRRGRGLTLHEFAREFPDGWLGGGIEVAMSAKRLGVLGDFYLCRSSYMCFGENPDYLLDTTCLLHGMEQVTSTRLGGVTVDHYRASLAFKYGE